LEFRAAAAGFVYNGYMFHKAGLGLVLAAVLFAASQPILAESKSLTVLTINVWSGLDYRGSLKMGEYEEKAVRQQRTRALIGALRELAPDVLALNEANKLPRYGRRLAKALAYDRVWHVGLGGLRAGPVGIPCNLREGDVLLARPQLGLRPAGRRRLSGGPVGNFFTAHLKDATQVVAGRIRVAGTEICLFCTHWHASAFPTDAYLAELDARLRSGELDEEAYRKKVAESKSGVQWRLGEARRMLAFIERLAGGGPAILLGDFNALADSEEIGLLRQAGFLDAYEQAGSGEGFTWDEDGNSNIQLQRRTYPDEVPEDPRNKRIDYIFVRGSELRVTRAQVVLDRPLDGQYPSDHYGLLAEIEVR
jgi:endonuclease/exonuclease/phosphatase family metal-dependent hydrolase